MSRKGIFVALGLLFAVTLLIIFPVASRAQAGTDGNFVLVNYIGQEITLDLDDVTYTVPGTNVSPEGGRFELQLAPGEHKFAVTVPGGGGSAGEFTVEPGSTVAKAVRIVKGEPATDRNGILLEKPQDEVQVFDIDLLAAPAGEMPVVDTWQPVAAMPGQGSIVWINYSGNDELTVDLEGQLYKVPPQINGIPGRLQINVPAGFYRYTASVPFGSINGEITVVPGEVAGVNIVPDIREEPEYEIGEKIDYPPVELNLFQEDLTDQVSDSQAQSDGVPAALPSTGGEVVVPAQVEVPAPADGLLVKNYTGDTLVFTINGQAYSIPADTEQTIPLPTGSFNYTASLPFVATTGSVELTEGQGVELSIAINLAHDLLNVYQN